MQQRSGNPRRTLLRRAAWAAGGLLALVAGRRAQARQEGEAPSPASKAGPELRLYGRSASRGAPGRTPGAAWVVRRCELLDAPDGRPVGEFVATALAAEASFAIPAGSAAALELQTFRLGDAALFGIGAGGTHDGERAYALVGGTGRFAGARGTVLERQAGAGARRREVEFLVTLVG